MRMRSAQPDKYLFVSETDRTMAAQGPKPRHNIHSFPVYAGYILLGCLLILFGVVYYLDKRLPDIIERDESEGTFIGRNSYDNLVKLTSIGPRVTGSAENEVKATNFLINEINTLMPIVSLEHTIELDRQIESGAYHLAFKPYGIVNVYNHVQNIIVKLSPRNRATTSSLLINGHFDSVPTSPGASDDGISVTTMLEVLRILATTNKPLKHSVVFLFNGAEENPLQGSHAFITKHKWAKDVKAFINLEACGAGGREILFQAGPGNSWLMQHYASAAPRPHTTVVGEELFQSNVIPSDTDFRVFRDFGKVPGLDFAFAKNGYVYHTRFDHMRSITNGSYQHFGENILALVKSIADSDQLSAAPDLDPSDKIIFFDVFGLFIITYSITVSYIVNAAVIALTSWITYKILKDVKSGSTYAILATRLLLSMGVQVIGWILALVTCFVIGYLLDLARPMTWYASTWLLFTHFVIPTIIGSSVVMSVYGHLNRSIYLGLNIQVQLHALSTIILWNILLIVTMFMQLRSSFIFSVTVIFPLLAMFINFYCGFVHSIHKWLVTYLIGIIFPFMFACYMALDLFDLFVPTTGRIGTDVPVDIALGIIAALITIFATGFMVPLIPLLRKANFFLLSLVGVSFIMLVLSIITPLGFPYEVNFASNVIAPERYWLYHTQRVVYDATGKKILDESGVLMMNQDRNSPRAVENFVPEIRRKGVSTEKYCKQLLCCGFPVTSSRMLDLVKHSTWVPMEQPVFFEPTHLTFQGEEMITADTKRLKFTATGPDHFNLFFSPKPNVNFVSWSVLDFVPNNTGPDWNGRPTYSVLNGYGQKKEAWNFHLDFQMLNATDTSQMVVDIALIGAYQHEDKRRIPAYVKFAEKFPPWTAVTTFISMYEARVF